MSDIKERLEQTRALIDQALQKCKRPMGSVQLLAVSKTKPATQIKAAYHLGQRCFGENYLQEALEKQRELATLDIEWHFIGPIQSNKTRDIASHFSWVHSVDRLKIASRLNEQRPATLSPLNLCLQVNIDNEDSKSGLTLASLPALADAVSKMEKLKLRGLMAIPAPTPDYQTQLASFERLARALEQLQVTHPALDTLSMGMSGDLDAAIAAGSTIVRVGTGIFGKRDVQ